MQPSFSAVSLLVAFAIRQVQLQAGTKQGRERFTSGRCSCLATAAAHDCLMQPPQWFSKNTANRGLATQWQERSQNFTSRTVKARWSMEIYGNV